MYYNNYLMNVKTLMNAECVENEKNGFLGTDITYCGHTFNCCVDGYNVIMQYGNGTLRKVPKNIFTIAKKESTNIKHAEEIKNYMKKLLAFTGNYQAARNDRLNTAISTMNLVESTQAHNNIDNEI